MQKKRIVLLSSILVLCLLSGCKRTSDDDLPKATTTPELTITVTPKLPDATSTVAPSVTTELPIYTLSGDLTELAAVTATVVEETEITEQVVAEAVVDALADNAIYVTVNEVTRNGDVVIVDFDAATPPVSQVGASIEGLILDAFGQSLLDNISGCNAVSFSVEGGDYASGHYEMSKDDIYMRR